MELFDANYSSFFSSEYTVEISKDKEKYRGIAVTTPGLEYDDYVESEKDNTIHDWIKHGGYSADQPEIIAALRHFYDPIGLSHGKKYLTNVGTLWEELYPNPHIDAIEWAMNRYENKWNLNNGKKYLTLALEAQEENTKAENLAKAFRCLGEVLHNTADMGCPPHVRNDSHAAPFGWHGRHILGSPDPTEELFDGAYYIPLYMDLEADPDLEVFFNNATTIRSINVKLAEFTNANFFTHQTINGSNQNPVNRDGHYPQPQLDALDYYANDYIYYKTFANGMKIKMAKDHSYFNWGFRGTPYIDKECVESQVKMLIPNILWAGINVTRLFIPKLEVIINSVNNDQVRGYVNHIPTEEYNAQLKYSGTIDVFDSEKSKKLGELNCSSGNFIGNISDINPAGEIYAVLTFAGISVRSKNFKIGDSGNNKVVKGISIDFKVNLDMHHESNIYYGSTDSWDDTDVLEDSIYFEGGFDGNTFIGVSTEHNERSNSEQTIDYTIQVELDQHDLEKMSYFSFTSHEEKIQYAGDEFKHTYIIDGKMNGGDIDGFTKSDILYFYRTNQEMCSVLEDASLQVSKETIGLKNTNYWDTLNSKSTRYTCDSSSYLIVKIYYE